LTSLATKLDYDAVVSAVKCIYPGPILPIDLHRIEVMPRPRSTDHSRFVNGIVLDQVARHPDSPEVLQNCKLMTLNTSLVYEKTETHREFYCSTAEEREKLVESERKWLDERCKQIIDVQRRVLFLKDSWPKNAFASSGTHELTEHLVTLYRIDMTHETINVHRVNEKSKFHRHRQRFRDYAITAHTLPGTMDMQKLSKSRHPSGLVRKPLASTTTSSLRSSLSEGAGIPMAANLIIPSSKSERESMNFTTDAQSVPSSRSERECRYPRRGSGILIGFYSPASGGLSIRPYIDSVITMVGSSAAVSVVPIVSLAQVIK
jgi:hypothetical protein